MATEINILPIATPRKQLLGTCSNIHSFVSSFHLKFSIIFVMKTAAVLGLASTALAATLPRGADVYGGKDIPITDAPYQVEFDSNGRFYCGGVIIGSRYILTAGHCVQGLSPSSITIRAGSNKLGGGASHSVTSFKRHPKFSQGPGDFIDYDVAVLQLAQDLTFSSSIKAIAITDIEPSAGDDAYLTGFGQTQNTQSSRTLQALHYPIISADECARLNDKYDMGMSSRAICALDKRGGFAACHGDSGGPLVVAGKLAGTVSSGQTPCAGGDAPNTYANLANSEIRSFIKQVSGI